MNLKHAWCVLVLISGPMVRGNDGVQTKIDEAREHWAFRPVVRPALPKVSNPSWIATPIDAFVLERLEAEGLTPAKPADRRTLLRRVYFDLIGLPPSIEEQKRFLADDDPKAYERLVDDLLSRPQYGERWARFWLDVVRYAETNGYERDGDKPMAWKYRDYVIKAFNDDKPFDRFLQEQIAGDELPDADRWTRIATTFLRLGTWDDEPADPDVDRCDQLDDVLGTTTAAFLGMTLRCARCHDHKFEPLTQQDYYAVLAAFTPLVRPQEGRTDKTWPVAAPPEIAAWQRATLRHKAKLEELDARRRKLVEGIRGRIARDMPKPIDMQVEKHATAEEKQELERIARELAEAQRRVPAEPEMGYIWREEPAKPPKTFILARGEPSARGAEVEPDVPQVLRHVRFERGEPSPWSSNRRLALARWMSRPDHPLVARVFVNRVWQQHFGEGIAASENDFGVMGDSPTHPELLDWLAAEFVESGYRIKRLHRLLALSSAYRQSAIADRFETAEQAGEAASMLAGWRQRRLPAEMIRDAMLAVSGRLNLKSGGPSVYPPMPKAVFEGQSRPGEGWPISPADEAARRSVYVYVKRSLPVPELDLLDAPDTTCTCEQRSTSTTGVQALTFLNGAFTHQCASDLAWRLRREVPAEPSRWIERAFLLALGRPPTADEASRCARFLSEQAKLIAAECKETLSSDVVEDRALLALCLVLLNCNEFVTWN